MTSTVNEVILAPGEDCRVTTRYGDNHQLEYLRLVFSPLVKFPSSANRRFVAINRRTGKPFICATKAHRERVASLTDAYTDALLTQQVFPPKFGDARVHVTLYVGNLRANADSHNLAKGLCDWLEEMLIVDNDKQAQCFVADLKWYGEHKKDTCSTVVIQLFSKVVHKWRDLLIDLA